MRTIRITLERDMPSTPLDPLPPGQLLPGEVTPAAGPAGQPTRAASTRRRLTTEQLLGGAGEIEIDHRGAIYRLRITSLDKLILTK
jgi:hemin uptake protein HemP